MERRETDAQSVRATTTPIPGLEVPDPMAVLSEDERKRLLDELDEMARFRREVEASSGSLRLS
jgi:hypothetical protein